MSLLVKMDTGDGGKRRRWPLWLLAAVLIGVMGCQTVVAQGPNVPPEKADPDEKPPKPDPRYEELRPTPAEIKEFKRQEPRIKALWRAGKFANPAEKTLFDTYVTDYYFARWTWQEDIASLHKTRQDLRTPFRTAKGGEVFDDLNALALDMLNKLATGNYHPATQINAMLAIGELNRVEQLGIEPAVPLPEALKVLVAAVQSDKASDGVRVAAMVGVVRHAALGIPDEEARRSLTAAMLRLVAADLPAGPAAAGRQWMLAQALKTLGLLGSPGDGNSVFKAMLPTVANAKLSLCTRCIAADAIGHLKYTDAAGIDPVEAAATLSQLAADACAEEMRLLKPDSLAVARGRLKQHLDAVLTAVKAIADLTKEAAQQAWLAELIKSVKGVGDMLDDPRMRERDKEVKAAVEGLPKTLEAWLQKKPK